MEASVTEKKQKRKFREPHAFTIIFILLIVAAVLTWILPSGAFERVYDENTGRMIAVAGSYHKVEANPVGPWNFFELLIKGFGNASVTMICLLVVGGTFGLVNQSGAIDGFIAKFISRFKGKAFDIWSLIIVYAFFYILAATIGIGEQAMVFMPIFLIMSISLGYDAVVATAIMTFGLSFGYTGALTCPYSIILGQSIAGLPIGSALWFRALISPLIFAVGAWWIYRYAKKIKKDPSKSLVADMDYSDIVVVSDPDKVQMSQTQKRVLYIFAAAFAFMIFAIIKWSFSLSQLAAMYLIVAIAIGIARKLTPGQIADGFVEGAKTLLFAALLVGFARGIQTILEDGVVQDTVINALVYPLQFLPKFLLAPAMVLIQTVVNMIIPSQSAMAMVTMPIMAPLADLIGIQRQVAVLAYQFGDGITNLILPTWAILMIGLGFTKVPFSRWFKFALPICIIMTLLALVLSAVAQAIQIGPF